MKIMQPERKHMTVGGSRVSFFTYHPKAAKTIVAIHGFRGTHHGLEDIITELPKFRFIVPDLPGFGESPPMQNPHDTKHYAEFLDKFIAGLKLKEPPIVLGHSFGTIITSHAIAKNQRLASKLILIGTIANRASNYPATKISDAYYKIGQALPAKMSRGFLGSYTVTRVMSEVLVVSRDKTMRRMIHAKHRAHFSDFADSRAVVEAYRASSTSSVLEVADNLALPTLLIAGDKDRIAPLGAQRALIKVLPNGKLVTVHGTGHILHHEKPKEIATAIRQFLSR